MAEPIFPPIEADLALALDAYSVPALPADFAARVVALALADGGLAEPVPPVLPPLPRARPASRRWLRGGLAFGGIAAAGMLSISAAAMGFLGEPIRLAVHHAVHRVPVVGHLLERVLPDRPLKDRIGRGFFARREPALHLPVLAPAARIAVPAPALIMPAPGVPPPDRAVAPGQAAWPGPAGPPMWMRHRRAALLGAGMAGALAVHHWAGHHFANDHLAGNRWATNHWRRQSWTGSRPAGRRGFADVPGQVVPPAPPLGQPLGAASDHGAPSLAGPRVGPGLSPEDRLARRNGWRAQRGLPPLDRLPVGGRSGGRGGQSGDQAAHPWRGGVAGPGLAGEGRGEAYPPLDGWRGGAQARVQESAPGEPRREANHANGNAVMRPYAGLGRGEIGAGNAPSRSQMHPQMHPHLLPRPMPHPWHPQPRAFRMPPMRRR